MLQKAMTTTMERMSALAAASNEVKKAAASSIGNVLSSTLVSSARSSAGEVGMEMPPKSVRCVQLQCRKPSGLPEGGGAVDVLAQPSPPAHDLRRWHGGHGAATGRPNCGYVTPLETSCQVASEPAMPPPMM